MNATRFAVLFLFGVHGAGLLAQQPTCVPSDSTGEVGAVVGRAVDADSGIPLGFARLELQSSALSRPLETQSDRRGQFTFCAVPAGHITLWGQIGQMSGLTGPVALTPGQTLELTVEFRGASGNDGTLAGEVVDAGSGSPLEGVSLVVPDLGRSSISNQLGRFTFPSVPVGTYTLRVTRLGYGAAEGEIEIERGRITETRIRLAVKPIDLDPIVVTAVRRRINLPELEDFERRYYSGWGQFVLEEDIRMRSPMRLTDVLANTGLDVTGNGTSVIVRRTGCAPMVYIDGVKMTRLPRGGGPQPRPSSLSGVYSWQDPERSPAAETASAINSIHPSSVLAVEVYKGPSETPGQYIDSNSRCGVILIWTRRGREVRKN